VPTSPKLPPVNQPNRNRNQQLNQSTPTLTPKKFVGWSRVCHSPTLGVVGLVRCAVGGTGIKEWARGEELY